MLHHIISNLVTSSFWELNQGYYIIVLTDQFLPAYIGKYKAVLDAENMMDAPKVPVDKNLDKKPPSIAVHLLLFGQNYFMGMI